MARVRDTAGKDSCGAVRGYMAFWDGRNSVRAPSSAAVLAVAAIVAIVAAGRASGGDDASQPYPDAPALDHGPGRAGRRLGHDRARVPGGVADGKLDDGIEVFNVEGAGGTLGLSQLVSKDSGDPYQLMMTGLVMLGAIETTPSSYTAERFSFNVSISK